MFVEVEDDGQGIDVARRAGPGGRARDALRRGGDPAGGPRGPEPPLPAGLQHRAERDGRRRAGGGPRRGPHQHRPRQRRGRASRPSRAPGRASRCGCRWRWRSPTRCWSAPAQRPWPCRSTPCGRSSPRGPRTSAAGVERDGAGGGPASRPPPPGSRPRARRRRRPAPLPVLPVLVVRSGGRSFAVAVDAIVGKEEIVDQAARRGAGRAAAVRRRHDHRRGAGDPRGGSRPPPGAGGERRRRGRRRRGSRQPERSPRAGRSPPGASCWSTTRSASGGSWATCSRRAGFEVLTANDGAEALERLVDTTVDVVITDLEMPRVNGYELIENLRRRPSTREVPVVVLTTRAGEKHWALARRLGVRHYVTKPVDEQAFVRLLVRRRVGRRAHEARSQRSSRD